MNTKIICYLLGKICIGTTIALALPLITAFFYLEGYYSDYFIAVAIAGFFAFMFGQYGWYASVKDVTSREWISTIVFGWILTAGLCALPYVLLGVLNPVDAFFESISGLTTTGVTTISNINELPKSLLFWRSLTGWFGGIASIVVFVVILPQFAGSAVYLFNSEANGNAKVGVLPRLKDSGISLLYIYLVLTIILAVVLGILGLTPFEAINYACSTISTTGFAVHDSNMASWNNSSIIFMTAAFMIFAGGNFALYYHIFQNGFKVLWEDVEFKVYVLIIVVISILIAANLFCTNSYTSLSDLNGAYFQTISFASTTGYTVADYDSWPTFSKLLLGLLLFTGGCSGSAASGLKIGRIIVLWKILALELNRILHPQMLLNIRYNKRILPVSAILNISRFFFVYILIVIMFGFALAASGLGPEEALFGAASCISNNGPAFGMLGAVNAYAHLPMFTKLLLSVGMLLGRLEIFIVLAMLRKEFWRSTKRW